MWNGEAWTFDNSAIVGNDAELVGHQLFAASKVCDNNLKSNVDRTDQRLQAVDGIL